MKKAIKTSVSVHGAQELARLSDADLLHAAEAALRRALEQTAKDAKKRCPVDSGELRDNIRVRIERSNKGVSGAVIATAPHAKAVELGTIRSRAQPFLYPAYRENASQIKNALCMQLRRTLKGEKNT